MVSTQIGELENFIRLVSRAEPAWLILALLLQLATYISVAAVWYLALRTTGEHESFLSLKPLGIAKLFSDQAKPSGGMSDTAFFIVALNRRGIPNHVCMATLMLSLVAYYGAYLIAAVTTLLLLYFYHAIHVWIVLVVIVFSLVAVGIPAGALWLRGLGQKELPKILKRVPGLNKLMVAIAEAPCELLQSPGLITVATLLHASVFLLDAAT